MLLPTHHQSAASIDKATLPIASHPSLSTFTLPSHFALGVHHKNKTSAFNQDLFSRDQEIRAWLKYIF